MTLNSPFCRLNGALGDSEHGFSMTDDFFCNRWGVISLDLHFWPQNGASNGFYRSFLKPNYFVFNELCWSDPSTPAPFEVRHRVLSKVDCRIASRSLHLADFVGTRPRLHHLGLQRATSNAAYRRVWQILHPRKKYHQNPGVYASADECISSQI